MLRRITPLFRGVKLIPKQPHFYLSTIKLPIRYSFCAAKTQGEKMEFKAETKKLLDIVAKSLYTDSEVFLR